MSSIQASSDWAGARKQAQRNGWELIGTGHWAWVYGLDEAACRISPFDPAFQYFAEVCARAEGPHLPRVETVADLPGGGHSVVMERLEQVSEADARAWLEHLRPDAGGEIGSTRRLLDRAVADADLPLFEGLDLNPNNVMLRRRDGSLVLTDAFWINGPTLFELVTTDLAAALTHYDRSELERWAHIPAMEAATTARILNAIGSVSP